MYGMPRTIQEKRDALFKALEPRKMGSEGRECGFCAAAIAKEMESVTENLNGIPLRLRGRFPLIFPEVMSHLVDQRLYPSHL
jgi:hypothetical protein